MLLAPDFETFRYDFAHGLARMLDADTLGAFILVLANSMQDEDLRQQLAPLLNQRFAELKKTHQAQGLKGAPDDLDVFQALLKSGIDNYSSWQQHAREPWLCVYNPLRALRPERASNAVITNLKQDFNPQGFHFNKPFLRPEIFKEIRFNKKDLRVLYNKFPFAFYHVLIVVEPEQQHPQYLSQDSHETLWQFVAAQGEKLSGLGAAYNSLGACASVNHLHFQGFIQANLPIEDQVWQHNGGNQRYPLRCIRSESLTDSWALLAQLHADNQPYNMLYRAGVCYILPRQKQGIKALPEWMINAAWYETCGVFNIADTAVLNTLSAEKIEHSLAELCVYSFSDK